MPTSSKTKGTEPKDETLSVESLANLTDMIGLNLNIQMIPGDTFAYSRGKGDEPGKLVYNREQLLALPPQAAPGLIFHEVGHAHHSQSKRAIPGVCRTIENLANKASKSGAAIHQESVFRIIEAAEDERMESKMRDSYANLDGSYLPRVDGGWRAKGWAEDKEILDNISPAGAMTAEQRPLYWERVRTAVRGIASGVLNDEDLPKDMPWDELTVDAVRDLSNAKTVDDLMDRFSTLIPDFVRFREEYYDPPKDDKNKGDGDGNGDGSGMSPEDLAALQAEFDASSSKRADDDFNNGGGKEFSPPGNRKPMPYQGPAWSAVRRTCSMMLGQINRQVRRYLRDNEILGRSPGYKRGKLHSRSLIRAEITGSDRVYSQPDQKGQQSYAVALLIDASGSMQGSESDVATFPEVFSGLRYSPHYGTGGYGGAKWTFATRLCVGLSEAIAKYREVNLGVFRFDDDFTVVKPFEHSLNGEQKQEIMNDITGNCDGGTENAKAFINIADQMRSLNVDKRLCIVLTDGYFTDRGTDRAIQYMKNKGIEMCVLCVGCDPTTARKYVGQRFADKVTDDSIGEVLGRHLKRMVKGVKAA